MTSDGRKQHHVRAPPPPSRVIVSSLPMCRWAHRSRPRLRRTASSLFFFLSPVRRSLTLSGTSRDLFRLPPRSFTGAARHVAPAYFTPWFATALLSQLHGVDYTARGCAHSQIMSFHLGLQTVKQTQCPSVTCTRVLAGSFLSVCNLMFIKTMWVHDPKSDNMQCL